MYMAVDNAGQYIASRGIDDTVRSLSFPFFPSFRGMGGGYYLFFLNDQVAIKHSSLVDNVSSADQCSHFGSGRLVNGVCAGAVSVGAGIGVLSSIPCSRACISLATR